MKEGVLKTHAWVHTQACRHLHPYCGFTLSPGASCCLSGASLPSSVKGGRNRVAPRFAVACTLPSTHRAQRGAGLSPFFSARAGRGRVSS